MDSFSEKPKKRTSAGKRKIPIQKIQEKSKRNVAFSKRRQGLFKKAGELSTLCGAEVAVVAYSESGKAFAFGHPSPDSVIHRYLQQHHGYSSSSTSSVSVQPQGLSSIQNLGDHSWLDGMGLEELEEYAHGLQMLLNMVNAKATSSTPTTSSLLVVNHPPQQQEEFRADVENVMCPLAAATAEEDFSADVDNVICPLAAAAAAEEEDFSAYMDDVIYPLAAFEEEFTANVDDLICPLAAAAAEEEEFDDVIIPSLEELMEMERIFYGC